MASVRLEGLEPTEEAKDIAKRFVEGELTILEMAKKPER
jgi:hypothetical protein